ncbi:MAG TPA: hypothetical protein VGA37_15310 [Gemmatimonadales bacterium]
MSVFSFTFDALHSGAYVAAPPRGRAVAMVNRIMQPPAPTAGVKDYSLSDMDGYRVGMVPAAVIRPRLGPNAPTIYLRRDGW